MPVRQEKGRARVAVIGVGGIGGYYAGLLARAGHDVYALARGANLAPLRKRGLVVRTPDEEWNSAITVSDDAHELSGSFEAADLVLVTTKAYSHTQKAVDEIVERTFSVIWKHGDVTRILDTSLGARAQVLILLYDASPQTETELRESTGYSNSTKFRSILRELHGKRLIFYQQDGPCLITPKGILEAEQLLIKAGFAG